MKVKPINKKVNKTNQDKVRREKVTKPEYIRIVDEADKYPLTMRIAAEIFRSGVTIDEFEDKIHLKGNTYSNRVHEALLTFHLGKGFDPQRIPAVRPVFLRYVSTEKQKELIEKEKRGRPSSEQAKQFFQKMMDDLLRRGWKEVDFINTLRDMIDSDDEPVMTIKISDDDEVSESVKKKKANYLYKVRVGTEWKTADSLGEADRMMAEDDKAILGPVEMPTEGEFCHHCHYRLDSLTVSIRTKVTAQPVEKTKKKKKGKTKRKKKVAPKQEYVVKHMHMGCYWMNNARPEQIALGMRVLKASTGAFYAWKGISGWVEEKPKVETDETLDVGTDNSQGVSSPEGQKNLPTAALQAAKA